MGRTRGCLWLTAGLVVAALAGLVAFIALRNAIPAAPDEATGQTGQLVQVVVADRDIPIRTLLTAEDIALREIPVASSPQGAVQTLEDAIGKLTLTDLVAGEILLAQRLVDPNVVSGDGRIALVLSEGEVLMAFPANDLMSESRVLKPGDHVDILFSLDVPVDRGLGAGAGTDEEQFTVNLLQNLVIAAIVGGETTTGGTTGSPEAILLTIDPQDALILKYAKDAGGIVDIVLRAPGDEAPFETEPVDVDFLINQYRIPIDVGR